MNVSAMIEKNFVRKKRVLLHQVAVHGVTAIKAMRRSSVKTVVRYAKVQMPVRTPIRIVTSGQKQVNAQRIPI